MAVFWETLLSVGAEALISIAVAVLTGIITYVGAKVVPLISEWKKERKAKVGNEQFALEERIAHNVVRAAEQVFTSEESQKKFDYAFDSLQKGLNTRGIDVEAKEVEFLIESAVKEVRDVSKAITSDSASVDNNVSIEGDAVVAPVEPSEISEGEFKQEEYEPDFEVSETDEVKG